MAGALLSRSRTYALATVQMESQASPGEQPADESWLLSRAISAHSVATTECSIHRRSPRPIRRSGRMASQPSVTFCDCPAPWLARAKCRLAWLGLELAASSCEDTGLGAGRMVMTVDEPVAM